MLCKNHCCSLCFRCKNLITDPLPLCPKLIRINVRDLFSLLTFWFRGSKAFYCTCPFADYVITKNNKQWLHERNPILVYYCVKVLYWVKSWLSGFVCKLRFVCCGIQTVYPDSSLGKGLVEPTSLVILPHSTLHYLLAIVAKYHLQLISSLEIFSCKLIGVTTLTFQGHVMSSVTWPFDNFFDSHRPFHICFFRQFFGKTHRLATIHTLQTDNR